MNKFIKKYILSPIAVALIWLFKPQICSHWCHYWPPPWRNDCKCCNREGWIFYVAFGVPILLLLIVLILRLILFIIYWI
jgi:hypothetical protein